uniref:3'-phosphate/5'-hydroxy nucleic acid ligase n=1 Tax=Paramoeba aestuarina TaxID=180227 RepID=A0A7S4U8G7_9EUKA|mmetsp:Transcript_8401/g.12683  ORF Transcript_8401/g.12683 Transcript_8401/m.12683 type:complete len:225 (+) Transcript_8401:2-676(+)
MAEEQRSINDPQLSCAAISSQVGREYFQAMNAAANFAFANRSCLTYFIRKAFENVFEQSADALEMSVLYDVSHNIAKRETHMVHGRPLDVMVHRKGATRSFGPNHADIPVEYRAVGQPVLVGGSMGTKSYILKGAEKAMELTFGTTCHGAGRAQSRSSARKKDWNEVIEDLHQKDITFRVNSPKNISEESPEAYKDVNTVVDVCHSVGISEKVARLQPLVVVKG